MDCFAFVSSEVFARIIRKKENTLNKTAFVVIAMIVFVMAGVCANAQDQPERALAEEMLNLLNVKETQEKALAMYKQIIEAQIQKLDPKSADPAVQAKANELLGKVLDMVKEETTWDKMKEEYITLYAQTYTQSELKDIIAFYKTPSGQAFIKKQPELLKRSFQLGSKMMGGLIPKIQAMVNEFKTSIESQPSPKPAAK